MPTRTTARKLKAAQTKYSVLDLRRQGFSYPQIGEQLGIHFTRAYQIVRDELKELGQKSQEAAEELRQVEEQRLDRILVPQLEKAESGDTKAAETVIKIMERRARLRGLDAPTKVEGKMSLPDGELLALARTFGLQVSPELERELRGDLVPPPAEEGPQPT